MKPYYEDDHVRLYCGDNMEVLEGAMGDADDWLQFDHVMTDPPYDEATHKNARSRKGKTETESPGELINFGSTTTSRICDVLDIAQPKRWTILTTAFQHALELQNEPPDGLEYIRTGAFIKIGASPQFSGDRPAQGWEAVAILHPKGKKTWNGRGKHAVFEHVEGEGPVFRHAVARGHHPTEKPLTLLTQWVSLFTDPGDLILDPWAGSGTTGVAAKLMGRRALLIEKEEKYCEIAKARLSQGVLPFGEAA